jgi:hypothetical protein
MPGFHDGCGAGARDIDLGGNPGPDLDAASFVRSYHEIAIPENNRGDNAAGSAAVQAG